MNCKVTENAPQPRLRRRLTDGRDDAPPKPLRQMVWPTLTRPNLCVISLLMLATIHGLTFLEEQYASRSPAMDSGEGNTSGCVQNAGHSKVQHCGDEYQQQQHYPNQAQYTELTHGDLLKLVLRLSLRLIPSTTPSALNSVILIALTTLALLVYQFRRLSNITRTSPVEGLVAIPGANPYIGHYGMLIDPSMQGYLLREHATPSGITAMWGPGLKRCVSVLSASHARTVLKASSLRDYSDFQLRHGRKTLGEDSLIFMQGGERWKSLRGVVTKAFNSSATKAMKGDILDCAIECVEWLKDACSSDGRCERESGGKNDEDSIGRRASSFSAGTEESFGGEENGEQSDAGFYDDSSTDAFISRCGGHGIDRHGRKTLCVEAEDFFKLYSVNVFGRVSMGYDFKCFPAVGVTRKRRQVELNRRGRTCTCLDMPTEAQALEFLAKDIGRRASPTGLINPALQFYSLPTRYNREYWRNTKLVDDMMKRIVTPELEHLLEEGKRSTARADVSSSQSRLRSDGHVDGNRCSVARGKGSRSTSRRKENMISHLVLSCMEQHFYEKSSSHSSSLPALSPRSPLSKCPFVFHSEKEDLSKTTVSCSTRDSFIPPASQVTPEDKAKVCHDLNKMLHTLMGAGFETVALSLSFVMYCLSKNQRCQERCWEEATRVMDRPKKNKRPDAEEEDIIDDDDLPYCRAVFIESIRIHSPVLHTSRVLSKDLTLDTGKDSNDHRDSSRDSTKTSAVKVPKGTRIIITPEMTHRDEQNFERASEFIPERWVRWDETESRWVDRDYDGELKNPATHEGGSEASSGRNTQPSASPSFSSEYDIENAFADRIAPANPANFISFSGGARDCLGRRLAIMESTVFIAVLLREMSVGFGDGNEDFEMVKERRFVTMKPVSLPIVFWRR